MVRVLVKIGNLEINMHMGRMPGEDKDTDIGHTSVNQGKSVVASKLSDRRSRRHRTDPSSQTSESTNPDNTLVSDF